MVQDLEAVHPGHDLVQEEDLDRPLMGLEGGDGLLTVGHLDDAVVPLQHIHQEGAVELGIIGNEDLFLVHGKYHLRMLRRNRRSRCFD